MSIKLIFDRFLHLISVPTCVCCKERLDFNETALCPKCSAEFEEIKTRNCSKCAKILSECSCSTRDLEAHFIKNITKSFRYNPREENLSANSLIYSLKRDNRSDVLKKCTEEMCAAILNTHNITEDFVITNVPRRRRAIVRYGIDHSELLAKSVAKRLGVKYIRTLKSRAKSEQKFLTREERLKNTDFTLLTKESLEGKKIIIVDDIITTGASVGSAAVMIRALRPKSIYAAALAIAYKDDL